MTNNKQLIIFIKAPVAGHCKTRLIPLLGEQGATDFYKHLVRHCVDMATQLNNTNIAIYTYPDTQHPFIQELTTEKGVSLHCQQGIDLGERMHNAIAMSLKTHTQCVLIGSDCPIMNTHYIEQAFKALESHDITMGPALDGGYVLIGSNKISTEVFSNTQWSTDNVLDQCIKNLHQLKYSYHLLPELWDIDTPSDFINNKVQIENLLNRQYITDIK